jgi:hypothetical protein
MTNNGGKKMNVLSVDVMPDIVGGASRVHQVIENLRSFNSKERFFLIGRALGNTDFTPSETFRKEIENLLDLKLPNQLFAAMDYHLDWLYASLFLAFDSDQYGIYSNSDGIIKGQQEDIDFIIAFVQDTLCHIVLIEAKGVMGWSNKQMDSKVARLGMIFGQDGTRWPDVKPHFVVLSPRQHRHLHVSKWPAWMSTDGQVPWIPLGVPRNLIKVTRCNKDGKADKAGAYWKIELR